MSTNHHSSFSEDAQKGASQKHMTKGHISLTYLSLVGGAVTLVTGLSLATPISRFQSIPPNAQATATVSAATFATWFETGAPSLNGVVKPANSITFPDNPSLANVDFYQWSYQMFLWLTSPTPPKYGGGGGRIFNSSAFYDVTPPDSTGKRTFIPHVNGVIRPFNLRAAQVGKHGLPVIMSRSGKMFEVEKSKLSPRGRPLIMNGNKVVEVGKITILQGNKAVFFDNTLKKIASPKAIVRQDINQLRTAQKLVVNKKIFFLDPFGNIIDTEEGQADGGALLTQGGSLIYYSTTVNDVYAYFLTGTKNGGITPAPTRFPVNQAQLDNVINFAAANGKTLIDPEALAIEIKSSWVEASTLPNVGDYITQKATVPTYDKSDPKHWVANGQTTMTLALIGMHVVGSAKGHPEMIWSTFEHFGNTPNATYTFNGTSGPNPKTITQNTAGTWLFCPNGASTNFNIPPQSASGADIVANGSFNIGPSNTLRFKPWGSAANQRPNPLISSVAASNTQIISMNNSVRSKLIAGDIRKNYFFMGATWTIGGASPSGAFSSAGGNEVGTSQLSNSTMETFQQVSTQYDKFSNNCFSCHGSNTTSVSHIFPGLQPLF
jgi:hypothetical protein